MTMIHEHRAVRPSAGEHDPFYAGYVASVPEGDVVATLTQGSRAVTELLGGLTATEAERAYAPGKWTIKEVVLHCSDAERIFAYRALRIGRGDETPLPGWDEGLYTPAGRANERTIGALVDELQSVRSASVTLFEGLPEGTWDARGHADGKLVTVRAIAWITAGHLLHHLGIIQDGYLDG